MPHKKSHQKVGKVVREPGFLYFVKKNGDVMRVRMKNSRRKSRK
jgi:hypothetical protein